MGEFRTIDIKKEKYFIPDYVRLRNAHRKLLLTEEVDISGTEQWLRKANVETVGLVEGDTLLGSAVLYIDRDFEIAVFARESGRGYGKMLLEAIEKKAVDREAGSVWAWVLESNEPAKKAFLKAGFDETDRSPRICGGKTLNGIIFKKVLKASDG